MQLALICSNPDKQRILNFDNVVESLMATKLRKKHSKDIRHVGMRRQPIIDTLRPIDT